MIKIILRKIIHFIRSNTRIKATLKKIAIKYPRLTAGMLRIYRKNIPEVTLQENMARLSDEEIVTLSSEAKSIYERLVKNESIT